MWDPKEFGNIQTIRLPSAQIWTPDILLYNSADEKFDSTMKVNAVVQHTGDILYVPPGIFKSECSFNIAAFPFDTQYCTLKFGSWTYDDTGINLTAESNKGQLDAYMKSAEWDLEVPCFLISCMTILGFLLAPDSGEKLTLQITILLSVVMFSLLMCEIMPPSSAAVPIITKYFMCIMVMSTISVIASVLVISVHFRTSKNHKMPIWANKYICHYLAWLLLMKRPRHDLSWKAIRRRWGPSKQESNTINNSTSNHQYKSPSAPLLSNVFESLPNNVIDVNRQSFQLIEDPNKERSESPIKYSSTSNSNKIPRSYRQQDLSREVHLFDTEMIRSELRVIISHLAILTHHTHHEEKLDNESQDWKFMAMVIDRLCLIFFTLSMALFTTLTLLSTPNFYKLQ
ncbi:unnamed protein product [Adineta steineri]|nr:unnamed protein product [Adineta steineri]